MKLQAVSFMVDGLFVFGGCEFYFFLWAAFVDT